MVNFSACLKSILCSKFIIMTIQCLDFMTKWLKSSRATFHYKQKQYKVAEWFYCELHSSINAEWNPHQIKYIETKTCNHCDPSMCFDWLNFFFAFTANDEFILFYFSVISLSWHCDLRSLTWNCFLLFWFSCLFCTILQYKFNIDNFQMMKSWL